MDSLWLEAPAPAISLWHEAGQLRWRLNRAALEWSLDARRNDADWHRFAARLRAATLVDGRTGRIDFDAAGIAYTAVPDGSRTVVWLQPEVPIGAGDAGFGSTGDKLELIQEFGRMGLFERDIRSGEGHWDKHMFRLFGVEPVLGTPPFQLASERVHPEDRDRVREQHQQSLARSGRYENRYRLLLPGDGVRHIHSLVEVRHGPDGRPAVMIGVLLDDTDSANQVRAQQALSAKLAGALELAGVALFRQDRGSPLVYLNDVGLRLLGQPGEGAGVGAADVRAAVHPDDLARIDQAAQLARAGGEAVNVTTRYRAAGQGYLHLLTRVVAERDASGAVTAMSGVAIDQTAEVAERERVQALRRSIELVADAAGVGLWSVDAETHRVEWNAQMQRIYGLPPDASAPTLTQWLEQLMHAEDRTRVRQVRRRAAQRGERSFDVDFRIVRPDGEVRWVVCRSSEEQREGRTVHVGIHLDVTERRATEAALQRQGERLAVATGAAGMGVWERGRDGISAFWDEQMYRLRGLEPDDPRPITELAQSTLAPGSTLQLDQLARRCMDEDLPYEHEFQVRWPDGSEHWLLTVGRTQRDEQGRALGMSGINIDITERKRADQALLERDAAERASRSKSEFLARMSHELRTPLNAVLGFAQLIEHDGAETLSPAQLERVSRIRTAGTHLLSLISDVLDLSAVEAGTLPIADEPVSLDLALEEVGRWVAAQAERAQVALHLRGSGLWVRGDPRRVRQVLTNLLTNAIKYNRAGGNVWVETEQIDAERCGVAIRDDGRGLAREQIEHLFEPFNRLGAEREGIEGVGLGLMIVRHLVEYMGGTIDVRSDAGHGTTMRLVLGCARGQATAATGVEGVAAPVETGPARDDVDSLAILYIEDNPVNLLLVEELVALRPNMVLTSAADGASGVARAIAERPDVVLIDMQLPDFDGYEVLRRLRAQPGLDATRMIALSANAMPEDVARAKGSGFDDYWTKPIDFRRFLDGLDALAGSLPPRSLRSLPPEGAATRTGEPGSGLHRVVHP